MKKNAAATAAMIEALAKAMGTDDLAKAGITTNTGLNYYDLRAPALLQIPFLTPLRDQMKRTQRVNSGKGCNWKVIRSAQGSGYDSMGYLPEGQRSGVRSTQSIDASASYVTIGEEGRVTDQAVRAAQGFEDVVALDHLLTLLKTQQKEENAILGGNRSIRLGTPGTPTTTAPANATSTLPATTYYVAVVALTNEGMQIATVANGVPTSQTVTGADGQSYTLNGGSSNRSAIATQVVGATAQLGATTPVIPGAVGYAWFVGTTNAPGSLYLQAITTINSFGLATPPVTNTQLASAITQDSSYNDGTQSGPNPVAAFDGLMTTAMNLNNGAYFYALPNGVAGVGTGLTSNLMGGVVELDNLILGMWNTNRVQVTRIYGSANTLQAVSRKMLSNGTTSILHVNADTGVSRTNLIGGGRVKSYSSPVGNPYGGDDISLMIHPNLPDGVLVGWAEELPVFFRNNETPAVAEMLVRQDYYGVEWQKKTLAVEYGVYADECLAVYAPFAIGVLCNIAVNQ